MKEFERTEKETNRLAREKSLYLLEHSANPVDWYPWGEEAFERARREDKPIFLSIGYSSCHWCHVMERESFEDGEVARLLNAFFVSVKVDREERPDIDGFYMAACRMLTGGGGWPLTIIASPGKEPFFAATYIPKSTRCGLMGMKDLLPRVSTFWKTRRKDVLDSAGRITKELRESGERIEAGDPGFALVERGFEDLAARFDGDHGGFGVRPKFPMAHNILFCLEYWKRTGEARAIEMAERTLAAMRRGGIWDHVGFGFHRYSVDEAWRVPHFEKMLYDQALLALAYTEAFDVTGREEYGRTAREIFAYVSREMTAPEGGFYSAEDADSEGREGAFYLWNAGEVAAVLGEEGARAFCVRYNIGSGSEEASRRETGEVAPDFVPHIEGGGGLSAEGEELDEFEAMRGKLFAYRKKRLPPRKDDKILADWNGLMIAALARGGRVFRDPAYIKAASAAVDFIAARMSAADGRLLRRYRDGDAGSQAVIDDYAFLAYGLIELYEATRETRYLEEALSLARIMVADFFDAERGVFFFTDEKGGGLPARMTEIEDGALPSGGAVAFLDLVLLARMTGDASLAENAARAARGPAGTVKKSPANHAMFLAALLELA